MFGRFVHGTKMTFKLNRCLVEGTIVGYIVKLDGTHWVVLEDRGGNFNIRATELFPGPRADRPKPTLTVEGKRTE